jgi:hypothetical protein
MGADDDYKRLLGGLTEALTQSEQKSVSELHLALPLPLQMSGKLDGNCQEFRVGPLR